jgi:hypothetical protein
MAIGHLIIEAETYPNLGIEKVEFYIDNELMHTSSSNNNGNYSWRWDEFVLFYHEITVKIYDIKGRTNTTTKNVIIFNFNIVP